MDVTLQSHEAKLVFPVPPGLRELSSDISREVLRSQPPNIYSFLAEYCEALLVTRENSYAGAKIVDEILEKNLIFVDELRQKGYNYEAANKAATKIQAAFRGYLERKRMKNDARRTTDTEANIKKATAIIQAAFHGFRTRRTIQEGTNKITLYTPIIAKILLKTGHSLNRAEEAACCIQRAYRGYVLKKSLQKKSESVDPNVVINDILAVTSHTKEEGIAAATIIQRYVRGFIAKRRVARMKRGEIKETVTPTATPAAYEILAKYNLTLKKGLAAVIIIQKNIRGYLVRRHIHGRRRTDVHVSMDSQNTADEEDLKNMI